MNTIRGVLENPSVINLQVNRDVVYMYGSFDITDYLSGEVLTAYKVVYVDNDKVYYADKDNAGSAATAMGVLVYGVEDINLATSIRSVGELSIPTATFDLTKRIYLGDAGALVQTPPTTGTFLEVGFPVTTTKMFVKIGRAIKLI